MKPAVRLRRLALRAMLATVSLSGAVAVQASDLILVNGRVFTAGKAKWAEAIAVTGDNIEKVGTTAEVMKTKTTGTKIIDLKGKMVIPGITDDHVHIWFGSLALNGFNFSTPEMNITPEANRAAFIAKVREYALGHPEMPIIFGRSAFGRVAPAPGPGKDILDEAVPDRPVIVHHTSEHALFVNSKMLELAGITDKPLDDPQMEKFIERDKDGHPTGLVNETAMILIEQAVPRMSITDQARILEGGVHYLNSFGITSIDALTGGLMDLEGYDALRKQGKLTLRIRQAFASVAVNHQLTPQFLANLETARTTYHDDWISANLVKFFMDGAPTDPLYDQAGYTAIVTELDKRGYQITSHALSPAGAKMALNGYEAAIQANGAKDRRFRMEHGSRFEPVDLPRFAKLGVINSTQPAFCCSPTTPSNPWNSLLKSGATLVFSSDWPCSWPPSPFVGIEQATQRYIRRPVTAAGPTGDVATDNMPDERITAEQALLAYTRDAAFSNKTEKKLGTLEAGKLADLVILNQDILAVPNTEIGKTKVLTTIVGGKIAFGTLPTGQ